MSVLLAFLSFFILGNRRGVDQVKREKIAKTINYFKCKSITFSWVVSFIPIYQILFQLYQRRLTCLNTDVPACRCHCSNIFAMSEEVSKINNFSILKKLKNCAPCDYLLFRKNPTTVVTPVVDTLGVKNVLRDARFNRSV